MSQTTPKKNYALFSLAILLLLVAGFCLYLGTHNFQIRSLGLAAILANTYCVRISRMHKRSNLPDADGREQYLRKASGPGRWLWIVSLALVPLLVVAFVLMSSDAVTDGGNATWPVDVFAGVAVVCTLAWSYLAAKIITSK
jgi:uncharacterized YccA/Bax inhibitor family protein